MELAGAGSPAVTYACVSTTGGGAGTIQSYSSTPVTCPGSQKELTLGGFTARAVTRPELDQRVGSRVVLAGRL